MSGQNVPTFEAPVCWQKHSSVGLLRQNGRTKASLVLDRTAFGSTRFANLPYGTCCLDPPRGAFHDTPHSRRMHHRRNAFSAALRLNLPWWSVRIREAFPVMLQAVDTTPIGSNEGGSGGVCAYRTRA